MEVFIRQITLADASKVTLLSHQLGYDIPVEQTIENIRTILASSDNDAFVAIHKNEVIGWMGVMHSYNLESPPNCEVRGLVVDENYRGKGIGKKLIEKAKQWGKEKGDNKLRVRTNMKRTATHLFYQNLGFIEMKQQKVFEMPII